jgi:large subunit ribosomal protein L21
MMAVIETGGKQYQVIPGSIIEVEKLTAKEGEELILDKVLMVDEDGKTHFGRPWVRAARVVAEVLGHDKADKIVVYKFKRRKGYHRKYGHRQLITKIKIKEIQLGGTSRPKPEKAPKPGPGKTSSSKRTP